MSTPALTHPERVRIPREIWVLVASAFVIALGFGLITPVLPQFAQSFGVGATASAIVVSVFAFFRLVFAPAGGSLIGRVGERPIYLAGLLIVAASTAATAFAQSYWQLLVFRGLGGIGSVMFTVSATALIVRLAPPSIRGRVSSAYGSAFLIGGIGGPAVGGALGGLGLRVPFLAYAGALVLAAALVAIFISGASLRPAPDAPVLPVFTAREALQDNAYRAGLVSGFANGWANFGVRNAIIPLFVAANIGKEPWLAGAVLAIYAGGNAVGMNVAGRLSDRMGRRPFIIGGLAVAGVATIATGLASSFPVLVVLSIIAGLGSGALNPSQQAAMADIVGQGRNGGPALASFQMSADAGAIIGPILAGALVDSGSFALAFAATGVLSLLATIPWARARETLPRTDAEARSGTEAVEKAAG
ncbi:putative MFS family arabinose efflux permease [Knoellia remsis]|uniref:Putative MFS family arabinose efflux permease n=1 Tax=Knoellia remsis TaxID=407159 RepID=A0A2T0UGR5_9MICO|nr:MFS transporter [Knoellia remsis]PRY57135.1 putative MFS family arabinose efflux permease [Knoellia remsis]